jgi:rhodanese-related sulfurtransferase
MKLLVAALIAFVLILPSAWADEVRVVSPEQAYALNQRDELVIVDIRQPEEWRQTGVAAGVARVPMGHPQGEAGFLEDLLQVVGDDKSAPVALICRTGSRTARMQRFLEAQGFSNVLSVDEGMSGNGAGPGWIARGLPVEPCRAC